jgi:hypothetical protein
VIYRRFTDIKSIYVVKKGNGRGCAAYFGLKRELQQKLIKLSRAA